MGRILKTNILLLLLLLACLHANGMEERTYRVINAVNGLADNSAQQVVCTRSGRMVISTLGNLNFYDGINFSHIGTREEYQYQLPAYSGNYHLYFDRHHHLWLKNTYMVTCVDMFQEQFVQNVDSVVKSMGCDEHMQDVFVDSQGNIWMLVSKGLYNVESKMTYEVLSGRNLQDLDVKDSVLLTFYDNGEVVGQDITTGKTVHRTQAYDSNAAKKYTNSSVILPYGDGLFQVRNGQKESVMMWFDARKHSWTTVSEFAYHINNLALHEDKIYMASEYGFWVYDIKSKELEWVKELTMADGTKVETDCNMIAFDQQGGIWIGTENRGVLYGRPTKPAFKCYPWTNPQSLVYDDMMADITQNITEFQGQRANCQYRDSRGWMWIGTMTGLYLFKKAKEKPVVFAKSNGLFNNVIHSVIEDRNHQIWVATSNGISCILFDADNEVLFVNSFNQNDGVPAESFNNCKAMMLNNGHIIMKAIDHVIEFNPEDLYEISTPHKSKLFPKMARLLVNGNYAEPNVPMDDNVIIDRAISQVRDISLNSDQTTVSITFSALNYYRPLQTYYRVRIKGLPDYEEWQEYSFFSTVGKVDRQGLLHFPILGLKPGDYTLEIQASLYPDQWDGTPFEWYIHVNEPWWRTTGMYWAVGIILMMMASVNLGFYLRNDRLRLRRNHQEGDIIRKIRQFVQRCEAYLTKPLSPAIEDFHQVSEENNMKLSREFVDTMLKVAPYVHNHMRGELTMSQLSSVANMDVVKFYGIVTADIYKSPRDLVLTYRLQQGAQMLQNTDKNVETIANECGFHTPNYFMGTFFHKYKMTPQEYREKEKK